MKRCKKIKVNKIFLLVLIFTMSISTSIFAGNEVNVDGADVGLEGDTKVDWSSITAKWDEYSRGARVSLWDVENQSLRDYKNMMTFIENNPYSSDVTYERVSKYNCLSDYTKPEIIALGGVMDEAIKSNYADPEFTLGHRLYEESVEFPELFARNGSAAERQKAIKEFYQNKENTKKLLNALNINEEDMQKWDEGKLCLLIEPLIVIRTSRKITIDGRLTNYPMVWALTCAELGLLALNGEGEPGKPFPIGQLAPSAYLALPYGTFKESEGLIKAIPAYIWEKDVKKECRTVEDLQRMVVILGCFEITCVSGGTDLPIMFHPNLENCGRGGISPEPAPDPKYTHWINCTHIEESNEPKADRTYWYSQEYTIDGVSYVKNFTKDEDAELIDFFIL